MADGLNKMTVIGYVGTDPEMRYTPNGSPVTSFRIATTRSYSSQDGERKQDTEWFTVVAWTSLAESTNQYLVKGQRAYVEGRLHSNTFQGNDGQTRFTNEIIASRIIFLDRPGGGEQGGAEFGGGGSGQTEPPQASTPDDLPF
jgi:single-strand DNA-binding protein